MSRKPTAWVLLLAAAVTSACAKLPPLPAGPAGVDRPGLSDPAAPDKDDPPRIPGYGEVQAKFRVYDLPADYHDPGRSRPVEPGGKNLIGTGTVDFEVVPANPNEKLTLHLDGAQLIGQVRWSNGVYSMRIGPGKPDDQVTVKAERALGGSASLALHRVAPAVVTVDQSTGEAWRPVTLLDSNAYPGPAAIRLSFSKPVRRTEVEQALLQSQAMPIRGLMQWENDKTLVWQIAALPPRLDFLLDGAHDQDGLPLPGGIPSLRVGDSPTLVLVKVDAQGDQPVSPVPPDIITAGLSRDGKAVNFLAWKPGVSRWDWQTGDMYLDLASKSLKPGRLDDLQPRIPVELSSWSASPAGSLVAGLRPAASGADKADLLILDFRGGRNLTYPDFIDRNGEFPTHLAWSADGRSVAALSLHAGGADVVAYDLAGSQRKVLVSDLPLPSGSAWLSWSSDGRYLLAGNLLADLQSGARRPLEGNAGARGSWEPGGRRLLYSAGDWGPVLLVDPTATGTPRTLGNGFIVGWAGPGQAYIIRWAASATRYTPPGQ